MDETIREQIIQELITRAAVIRTTGSPQIYATDIGAKVLRARPRVGPEECPCCIVHPGTEEAENLPGQCRRRMTVRVEGFAAYGAEDPSVVSERILGDLIRCFTDTAWDRRRLVTSPASPVIYLAPLAGSIVYQGGGLDEPPEDGALTAGATARYLITYWTKLGDPCSQ